MSADAAAAEPTMEEILASIRRIISEDDKPAESPAEPDEVLELTEAAPPEPEPVPEPVVEAKSNSQDDIDSLFDDPEPTPESEPVFVAPVEELIIQDWAEPEPEPVRVSAPSPRPVSAPVSDTLMSQSSVSAASSALSRLQSISGTATGLESVGGITVEALARELLRPMLKEWLDTNLPAIVEAQVAAEVARIGRGI